MTAKDDERALRIWDEIRGQDRYTPVCSSVRDFANRLLAEQKSAEAKDAERYRWINAKDNFLLYVEDSRGVQEKLRLKCGESLDRYIDAALAEQDAAPIVDDDDPMEEGDASWCHDPDMGAR